MNKNMTNALNPKIVALSLASVAGILYILCALFVAIVPQASLNFFAAIFHGIDITQIKQTDISFGSTLLGLVEIVVYSFIAGWLFAAVYNYFVQKVK